jgi:hypothetical protein
MKTQIIKKAAVKKPEFTVGQYITFMYEVPLQNIGWGYEKSTGVIQKVNRITVHVLDNEGNLWKVNNDDVIFQYKANIENML